MQDSSLKKGGKMVSDFIEVIREYGVQVLTGLISFGILADVATNGSIPVLTTVQTVINTTVTTLTGFFTSVNESMTLVITLIILVIVNMVFESRRRKKAASKGSLYK